MERLWNLGGKAWNYEYKYRRGGKTLCALYLKKGSSGFMVIFGKGEQEKFEENRQKFSSRIQEIYDSSTTYHDGKWMMFPADDSSLFDEYLNLLMIKRRPKQKIKISGGNMKYPWIDPFLREMNGVTYDFKEEWNWDRYMIDGKMFAAICRDDQGKEKLISLKLDPLEGDFLRQQYKDIIPGYYMNKVHWNSVLADGEVPDDLLKDMLEKSYALIFAKLTKKRQKELCGEAGGTI